MTEKEFEKAISLLGLSKCQVQKIMISATLLKCQAYDNGFKSGYENGYDSGYEEGYNNGYSEGRDFI